MTDTGYEAAWNLQDDVTGQTWTEYLPEFDKDQADPRAGLDTQDAEIYGDNVTIDDDGNIWGGVQLPSGDYAWIALNEDGKGQHGDSVYYGDASGHDFERGASMGRNSRKPKKANHGKRGPCNIRRRKKSL